MGRNENVLALTPEFIVDKKDKLFAMVVVAVLVAISVFYDWILRHWKTLEWPALGLLLTLVAFSKNDPRRERMLRYAEARRLFRQQLDDYPWIKIYYAVYAAAIAVGAIYAVFSHIRLVGFFIEGGLFLLIGGLLLPMVMLGLVLLYEKTKVDK